MNQIPSMWRTELWHPMLVHFPVATLLLATIAGLCAWFVRTGNTKVFLSDITSFLLLIGVATGWIGIYTGLLAYNIEVRKLCDPQVLKQHQNWAYIAMIIYSLALVLQLLPKWLKKTPGILALITSCLLLFTGSLALAYCGHLGAAVVYQQGGGTYKPAADCKEFEK